MVGRLVEHQHVVSGDENPRQRDPAALATAEVGDIGVEVDVGKQVLDDCPRLRFGRPDVVGPAADDDLADGRTWGEVVALPQVAHRKTRCVGDPPGIGIAGPRQHLEQRRLAVSVTPDDADRVALVDAEADGIQQRAGAVTDGRAFHIDQVGHQPPMIGRASRRGRHGLCAMMTSVIRGQA